MPDYDLKLAVAKIKTKRLNFALYKGAKDNQMLITPQPAKPKLIAAMEEEIGEAKRIAKGVCFWENDQLIFATKNTPAPAWETMATKIFKANECAKFLPVIFRQLKENESDEAAETEGEEEVATGAIPPPPPPPPAAKAAEPVDDLAAQWKALKLALYPDIKKGLEGAPANRDEILKLAGEATRAEKAGDFATAIAHFKTLQPLLRVIPAAPPPPPVKSADEGAAFNARLAALLPKIKAALAADPKAGEEIKLRASEAGVFARKKDFAEANGLLDQVEALLGKGGAKAAGPKIFPVWQQAVQQAVTQIGALQARLRQTGDEQMVDIAERGMDEVLAKLNDGLGDRFADFDAGGEDAEKALEEALATYRDFAANDPVVGLLDENPFGVAVTLKKNLGGALDTIAKTAGV